MSDLFRMPDLVVVGGGATGLTAAILLAQSGYKVSVIECQALPPALPGPGPDPRVLAITPASEVILRRAGAWSHLDVGRIEPWTRMRVWEQPEIGEVVFQDTDINTGRLGTIVENVMLVRALHAAAVEAGVSICTDALESLHERAGGVDLVLASGDRLSVKTVIGADGAHSRVRELSGLKWRTRNQPQQAIVAEVSTEQPYTPTAWQRFTSQGPVALLPLFNHHYVLIWSTEDAEELMSREPSEFEQALAQALDGRLGYVTLHSARHLLPLGCGFAPDWCTQAVALIGDAAHVVHPLAGLGQNLGLMDAAVLQEEWLAHPFERRALRAYERRRKFPTQVTQGLLEGFRVGFSCALPGAQEVRRQVLHGVDLQRWLRAFFIRQANGTMGAPAWVVEGLA